MSETGSTPSTAPPRSGRDRWVKVGFLVVTAAVVFWIYRNQVAPPVLTDWSEDANAALAQARAEDRRVLLLFIHAALSDDERRKLIGNTIPKNGSLIAKGAFLRVKVLVPTDMDTPLVREYGIQQVPTLVMLSPQGKELGRTTSVGETDWGRFLQDPNTPAR